MSLALQTIRRGLSRLPSWKSRASPSTGLPASSCSSSLPGRALAEAEEGKRSISLSFSNERPLFPGSPGPRDHKFPRGELLPLPPSGLRTFLLDSLQPNSLARSFGTLAKVPRAEVVARSDRGFHGSSLTRCKGSDGKKDKKDESCSYTDLERRYNERIAKAKSKSPGKKGSSCNPDDSWRKDAPCLGAPMGSCGGKPPKKSYSTLAPLGIPGTIDDAYKKFRRAGKKESAAVASVRSIGTTGNNNNSNSDERTRQQLWAERMDREMRQIEDCMGVIKCRGRQNSNGNKKNKKEKNNEKTNKKRAKSRAKTKGLEKK